MRRFFVLIAAVALITAACKIETNIEATLNADGTGTVAFEIGLDDEARDFLMQSGDDPFADTPAGATNTTVERGDMTYYVSTVPFSSAAELTRLVTEETDSPFGTFSATFSETRVRVEGSIANIGGDLLGEGGVEGMDPGIIEESISANIRIVMPGKVTDTNADSTDGSTVTWSVPLFGGGALDIYAESDPTQSPGGGGFPVWLIIVIVVVVLAAAGYFVMSRRNSTTPPMSTGDAAPPAEPTEG